MKGRYVGTSSKDVEDDEDELAFSSLCFLDEVPEKKSIGLSKFRRQSVVILKELPTFVNLIFVKLQLKCLSFLPLLLKEIFKLKV